jgi:hypothetical protein
MQADQGKAGKIMVKPQICAETHVAMAVITLQQRATVRVVAFMTTPAVFRQRIREPAGMTGLAGCLAMAARQGEAAGVEMIETHFPGALFMTISTLRPVPTEVDIVTAVTPLAIRRQCFQRLP